MDFPRPVVIKALPEFLGLVTFYNCFLPHTAQLPQPLYRALRLRKSNDQVNWTPEQIQVFNGTKSALVNAALLAHLALWQSILLMTDVLDMAVGAVVEQRVANAWQPRMFSRCKLQWSRLLGIVPGNTPFPFSTRRLLFYSLRQPQTIDICYVQGN